MTEKHWINNDLNKREFWATAGGLGLSHEQVHKALQVVDSTREYGGTMEEAIETLTNYAAGYDKKKEVELQMMLAGAMQNAPEAAAVAWCTFQRAPGYPTWSLTVREVGLVPELATQALRQIIKQTANVEMMLVKNGYMAVFNGRDQAGSPLGEKAAESPAELAQRAPAPATPAPLARVPTSQIPVTPPPPPAAVPPQGPPPQPAMAPGPQPAATTGALNVMPVEFIKTASNPSGTKIFVEFWRPNDRYARITWRFGGEKLLEVSPELVKAGYTPAHFASAGGHYPTPVNVIWTQGKAIPNTDPVKFYKDIQRVEVR